jgi:molybdate transport system substrate-binding protein
MIHPRLSCSFFIVFCLLGTTQVRSADLSVAAAADLASLAPELTAAFQQKTAIHLTVTLGASGILKQQIANGAPYDVFLSANEQYVRDLASAGQIVAGSVRVYAFGRLGLWSAEGQFKDAGELTGPALKHLAIPNPEHAPYGVAARDFLRRKGLWDALESRIVYGENVRQTLQYAETGNADAVITAWSLVLEKKGAVLLPADHAPISQAVGIVSASKQQEAARRFLDFLSGPEGTKLLREHGLTPAK